MHVPVLSVIMWSFHQCEQIVTWNKVKFVIRFSPRGALNVGAHSKVPEMSFVVLKKLLPPQRWGRQ